MARRPRNIIADLPFHVMVRGNNRQPVFLCEEDRLAYKADLQAACLAHGLAVHAYVLLPAEVHLVATPEQAGSLALVMQAVGRRYVRRFNRRHQRTGTLWEGRYRAAIIQDHYLLTVQQYLEREPHRVALVASSADYPWSSHRHYLGLEFDTLVSPHRVYWELGNTPFEREAAYRQLFEAGTGRHDPPIIAALVNGKPLADPEFLRRLEAESGRQLMVRPVGRPRKSSPA